MLFVLTGKLRSPYMQRGNFSTCLISLGKCFIRDLKKDVLDIQGEHPFPETIRELRREKERLLTFKITLYLHFLGR